MKAKLIIPKTVESNLKNQPMSAVTLSILNLIDSIGMRELFLQEIITFIADKVYFTTDEVAKRYKVSKQCVKIWQLQGKITPSFKVSGGTVRFTLEDLHKFEKLTGRESLTASLAEATDDILSQK